MFFQCDAHPFSDLLKCDGRELIEPSLLSPDFSGQSARWLLFWRQFCILISTLCLALPVQLIWMPECQLLPGETSGF